MKECKHCEFSKAWHEEAERMGIEEAGINPMEKLPFVFYSRWKAHPFEPVEEGVSFQESVAPYLETLKKITKIEKELLSVCKTTEVVAQSLNNRILDLEERIEPKVAARLSKLEKHIETLNSSARSANSYLVKLGDEVTELKNMGQKAFDRLDSLETLGLREEAKRLREEHQQILEESIMAGKEKDPAERDYKMKAQALSMQLSAAMNQLGGTEHALKDCEKQLEDLQRKSQQEAEIRHNRDCVVREALEILENLKVTQVPLGGLEDIWRAVCKLRRLVF
jgi:hypothetical protein